MTNNTHPLVSVVIPTYNRGWIIQQAVDSVLAQEFPDFELLIVDDGSTDQTLEVLVPYRNHLKIYRQEHLGVSAARNTGVIAAAGRYIAFLDTDDLWLSRKLSVQVGFFHAHPDARICQTEEIWIRNGVRIYPKKRHRKPSGMIFERSLDLCLVSPSAVMMDRRLFDEVGLFDERLAACEDYDMWLRIGCRYPVHLIDSPLVVKRGGHADQLSSIPGLDRFRIASIEKLLRSGLLSCDQHRSAVEALKKKCAVYAGGCRKRGRPVEADYYERLAEADGPSCPSERKNARPETPA